MQAPRAPILILAAALAAIPGCAADSADAPREAAAPACADDDGGITLPDAFCAVVVAEGLERPRHMAVTESGDLYVALNPAREGGGGLVGLRDTTGDGRMDVEVRIDEQGGTGVELHEGWLYFGRVLLAYGARTPADRLYRDELTHWASAGIEVAEIVDRAGPEWLGRVGIVTQLLDQRDWRERPATRTTVASTSRSR